MNNRHWHIFCGQSPFVGVKVNSNGEVPEIRNTSNWAWTRMKFTCADINGKKSKHSVSTEIFEQFSQYVWVLSINIIILKWLDLFYYIGLAVQAFDILETSHGLVLRTGSNEVVSTLTILNKGVDINEPVGINNIFNFKLHLTNNQDILTEDTVKKVL